MISGKSLLFPFILSLNDNSCNSFFLLNFQEMALSSKINIEKLKTTKVFFHLTRKGNQNEPFSCVGGISTLWGFQYFRYLYSLLSLRVPDILIFGPCRYSLMIPHRYFVSNLENLLILTIVHFGILSIVKKCPAKKEYWAFPVRSSGAGKCFRIRFAFDLVSEILGTPNLSLGNVFGTDAIFMFQRYWAPLPVSGRGHAGEAINLNALKHNKIQIARKAFYH